MMRKMLLSLSVLAGATAALASVAPAAHAAPVAFAIATVPAHVQTVQYYEGRRHDEWHRREAYERWRRHEERRRWHEHHRGW